MQQSLLVVKTTMAPVFMLHDLSKEFIMHSCDTAQKIEKLVSCVCPHYKVIFLCKELNPYISCNK